MARTVALAPDIRVLFRPFHTYRGYAARQDGAGPLSLALCRPLFVLVLYGGFVSLLTAGRLVPMHVVGIVLFWAFIPAYQIVALRLTTWLFGPREKFARTIDLLFVGQAPWILFFAVLSGICLFSPRVYDTFIALASLGILPGLLALTLAWSVWLTLACFRAGLRLSWKKALCAWFTHYFFYVLMLVSWYVATNQIQSYIFGSSW